MVLILAVIGVFNIIKYHVVWANKIEVANSFDKNLMDVNDFMKSLPAGKEKLVMAEVMERIPLELFNQNRPDIQYFYPGQASYVNPDSDNFMIILTYRNDDAVKTLVERFPNLSLQEMNDGKGTRFWVLK
jgi:hypothetical protein